MTQSFTTTATFTRTHAKHLAAKVVADPYQCYVLYDQPATGHVADYEAELIELLAGEYVAEYEFGFKKNSQRIVCWRYTVGPDGGMHGDSNAGSLYARADVAGAAYYNFLTYSAKWFNVDTTSKARITSGLPFSRGDGTLPGDGAGLLADRSRIHSRWDARRTEDIPTMVTGTDGLFGHIDEFPHDRAQRRYSALVGLDHIKQQLVSEARVLLDPRILEQWSTRHHGKVIAAVAEVIDRTSLVVLAGDVGTGKTELAETVGDQIARELSVPITLLPLSLTARGHGAVGEMTTLITKAFEKAREVAAGGRSREGSVRHGVILLIDEADAIAQSRELTQMHHEDRAGVNALIRGIDGLRQDRLPVLTIMCTNRIDAIDPAVRRRAAAIYEFSRPNEEQRHHLLARSFGGVSINPSDMSLVVKLTGAIDDRAYGATYSDLRQRFVPTAVLDALHTGPLTGTRLVELARHFQPTRPFDNGGAS